MMRVQIIVDCDYGAMHHWASGIAKYSKHEVDIRIDNASTDGNPDFIQFLIGGALTGEKNTTFMRNHKEIPCGVCVSGPITYKALVNWFAKNPDSRKIVKGAIVLGEEYEKIFRRDIPNVRLYQAEVGVDSTIFPRKPPPNQFTIGYAEKYGFGDVYVKLLRTYGYPIVWAGDGKDKPRLKFSEMPAFYEKISVLVDNAVELTMRPGGLMYLEAAATGRPSLAKKTLTTEWFPQEFLCSDEDEIKLKLHKLSKDAEYYNRAVEIWSKVAESRDYRVITKEYDDAFEAMVKT